MNEWIASFSMIYGRVSSEFCRYAEFDRMILE